MGDIFRKVMGPLMTAGGVIAAPFTGGATIPIAMSGLSEMMGPGGVMGPSTSIPSIKAPALTSAPFTPGGDVASSLPTSAGSGFTLSGGGAGPSTGAGAGVQSPDVLSQAIQTAMGGTGASADPFAAYGGYGAAA